MLGSSGLLRSLSSTGFEALASLSLALFSGYLISLGLYRLYLSPLSKFPGPKITAVTGWYESYCDLIKDGGGQFTKQIHSWHETYGPIVRINPWEIHVNDPSYYENIYSASLPFDKMKSYENRFNAPLASFSTSEYDLHRKRRGALNPYFSRQKVAEYMPKIRERAHKLLQRLQREFADKRRVLVLNDVFACFTTDTVIDYAFDFSMDLIDEPKFCAKFTSAVHDLQISMHYGEAFPWTVPLIDSLPESIVTFLFPPTKSIFEFRKELRALIQYARSRHAAGEKPRRIVFDKLLQSDLPQEELSMARLEQEALSIVAAGLDSTKTVACNFTYRVLARPDVLSKLKAELAEAIPNPRELPSWTELEGLPYFGACLQEAMRFSYGTVSRSPRVAQDRTLQYGSFSILPGTPVSMQTYTMHHNEDAFPRSWEFEPERWLCSTTRPDDTKPLSSYMVTFGKGSRACLGINLAYAMLYSILPLLFRNLDFELYETTREAVDCYRTALGPLPKPGTKGVRVFVK